MKIWVRNSAGRSSDQGIDGRHEVRGHGAHYPRIWDEVGSAGVDSWGYSSPTSNVLTSDDPYRFVNIPFASDWSRSIGRGGRWWYEEIYAGMNPGSMIYKKQTTPEEISINIWMTLAKGGAGALLWQYRPEYLSFEAPGLNLVSLGGVPAGCGRAGGQRNQAARRASPVVDSERRSRCCVSRPKRHRAPVWKGRGTVPGSVAFDLSGSLDEQHTGGCHQPGRRLDYRVVYLPDTVVLDPPLIKNY